MKNVSVKNRPETTTDSRDAARSGLLNLAATVKQYGFPIKLLPDVREFRIELGNTDVLFRSIGIQRKHEAEVSFIPGKNKRINRYVVWQFLRLRKARNNPAKYWAIAWSLMGKTSYLALSLNKTNPGWHRKEPYWKVLKLSKKVRKLVKERSTDLDYRRVYIPKPGDKGRPLGVPTPEGITYTHMYTNLLRVFIEPYIPQEQHAYRTNKGVVTAGKEVIEKVLSAEDIYEFDLKQFFPSVSSQYISRILHEKLGLPVRELYYLQDMFKALPKLPQDLKLPEDGIGKRLVLKEASEGNEFPTEPMKVGEDFYNAGNQEIGDMLLSETAAEEEVPQGWVKHPSYRPMLIHKTIEMQWAILSSFKPASYEALEDYFNGVPQGAPFSPILSIMALVEPLMKAVTTVMYADDGVIYGTSLPDNPFPKSDDTREANIIQNEEKSGWVKRGGVWKTKFKFLGFIYDPFEKKFQAQTRSGSDLEFTTDVQFITGLSDNLNTSKLALPPSLAGQRRIPMDSFLRGAWNEFTESNATWEDLFKGKFVGFAMSRMQGNSGNPQLEQDFSNTFVRNSWMDTKSVGFLRKECVNEHINIFNSSSFANTCLTNDLKKQVEYKNKKSYVKGLQYIYRKGKTVCKRFLSTWGDGKRKV